MSKDFTPQIIYFMNKQYNNLYLNNIIFTDALTGESHKMFTDEEMKFRYKYPTFATLYADGFIKLYHELPSYKVRHVFEYMDEMDFDDRLNDLQDDNNIDTYDFDVQEDQNRADIGHSHIYDNDNKKLEAGMISECRLQIITDRVGLFLAHFGLWGLYWL